MSSAQLVAFNELLRSVNSQSLIFFDMFLHCAGKLSPYEFKYLENSIRTFGTLHLLEAYYFFY